MESIKTESIKTESIKTESKTESTKTESTKTESTKTESNDFSTLFTNLGNVVESFSQMSSTLLNVGDILNKIGHEVTEEQEKIIENLMFNLSKDDRKQILSIIDSKNKLIEWWSERCEDETIVNIMVSCSDAFHQATNGFQDILDGIVNNQSCTNPTNTNQTNQPVSDLIQKFQDIVQSPESIESIESPESTNINKILSILGEIQKTQTKLEHKIDDLSIDIELLVKKV